MTEEEKDRYLGFLIENLYCRLKSMSEGTISKENKREIAIKAIYKFYINHKEEYGIKDIEEVTKELYKVHENMNKDCREDLGDR